MEQYFLIESVISHGLEGFFSEICGIDDHHAENKTEIARQLVGSLDYGADRTIFIGDTLHDHEVAIENGLRCILINHGHQSEKRLRSSDNPVLNSLTEIPYFIGMDTEAFIKKQ